MTYSDKIKQSVRISNQIQGAVMSRLQHDSAMRQVKGEANYIDDLPELPNTLHVIPVGSTHGVGRVLSINLDEILKCSGVIAILTAKDIPGINDVSPTHSGDDPILAPDVVRYVGEPIIAIIATDYRLGRIAAKSAKFNLAGIDNPVWDIDDANLNHSLISPDYQFGDHDIDQYLVKSPHQVVTELTIGGQEQFYLEGQISYAIPGEIHSNGDQDLFIHCSTQHPSEVQHNVAHLLNLPAHCVTVEIRRMGGGFGGKESQATQWAALAALAALKTGRPSKCRLDRDDDMIMTGKRHDFKTQMQVGFDQQGRIKAAKGHFLACAGCSKDLSDAIVDRAMFHFDNAYCLPKSLITTRRLKTNTVSNTAFRGFGGPQGMLAGEWMVESIARYLGKDALEIRKLNFYDQDGKDNITPFGMKVKDFILTDLVHELEISSNYWQRRKDIQAFNTKNKYIKRGLSLTPVKFGISFTTTFLNQAASLVHIYKDGSIMLNHGGTEMGQGLFIKVAQIVADVFKVDCDRVRITATSTDKIPNTSATAASSGTDMNGMAAFNAANEIKQRLIDFAATAYKVQSEQIEFCKGYVRIGNQDIAFSDLIEKAYLGRVQLSSAGFYKTPEIAFDRASGRGRPFLYYAYGAAVSEVAIDCLTGEARVVGVDILHDVGRSINPAIDLGQIEGGYIQGLGWLMMEELYWDNQGRLRTHAPSTYKIPTILDRPSRFNVNLWSKGCNVENTIHRSKAVGEPPLMLAISAFLATADAIHATNPQSQRMAKLQAPATPEHVLYAIEDMKKNS